jgi:hypothetical protein
MLHLVRYATHLLAPLAANCSDFKQHWEAAARRDGTLAGRWDGDWVSIASGHRGPLKCVIEIVSEEVWHARFRAGYTGIFRACYETDFHVARLAPDRWTFSGRSDLGSLAGGLYEYDGDASSEAFTCRYKCKYDHGEFRLRRGSEVAGS